MPPFGVNSSLGFSPSLSNWGSALLRSSLLSWGPLGIGRFPRNERFQTNIFGLNLGEIMDILGARRYGRVPTSLWSLLGLLRRTRNDLAHMAPVDLPRIRQIFQEHDLVQRRFGTN